MSGREARRLADGYPRLVVDVSAVSDMEDEDGPSRVVYLVDDAVVTNPNPPAVAADPRAQPGGRGLPASNRIASQTRSNDGDES